MIRNYKDRMISPVESREHAIHYLEKRPSGKRAYEFMEAPLMVSMFRAMKKKISKDDDIHARIDSAINHIKSKKG